MMRKRRYTSERCNGGKNYLVWDNETGECLGFIAQIVGRLNLQEDIINDLKKEIEESNCEKSEEIAELKKGNEKLRQMIKGNVFQQYREGSLSDLEFKAIAYDDIVKLEMSYESEPKVIVICKRGKKETVKSFCHMFIPFGVCYEIKELDDE